MKDSDNVREAAAAVSLPLVSAWRFFLHCSVQLAALLILITIGAGELAAQEEEISGGDIRRIVTARSPMTRSLGGGQAGELLLNTKVRVLEERGAWAKVSTEGWVRIKTLSESTGPSKGAAAPAPIAKPKVVEGLLRVTEFIKSHRSDVSPPREYVVLTVVNDSPRTIRGWSGLLVAVDESETSVFREQVSEENIEWKPSETREVTFYWQPSEEGYAKLQAVNPEAHRMLLVNVEVQ